MNEREETMLNAMCDYLGTKQGEYIRWLWTDRYNKTFRYLPKKERPVQVKLDEPTLTPEQACERKGGKIVNRDGVMMCSLPINSAMTRYIPLSKPELFK
jgi:hypothetical protein